MAIDKRRIQYSPFANFDGKTFPIVVMSSQYIPGYWDTRMTFELPSCETEDKEMTNYIDIIIFYVDVESSWKLISKVETQDT